MKKSKWSAAPNYAARDKARFARFQVGVAVRTATGRNAGLPELAEIITVEDDGMFVVKNAKGEEYRVFASEIC